MGFFDQEKNVENYIEMALGYDGCELIEILKKYLPSGSRVLELGMGPAVDLNILNKTYQTTGSDSSKIFVNRYRAKNPSADLLELDAVTLETDRVFDCIYSNKVLHHLKRDDMILSLKRQKNLIEDDGLLFHSFWHGDKEEEMHGLRFVYYTMDQLEALFQADYQILDINQYREMEEGDSVYVCLKKK